MALVPASFNINDKRQRTVTFSAAKRPIDKVITVINHANTTSADVNTQLYLATYPSTMTGLRWDLSFFQGSGTAVCTWVWAIIYLRQGETLDTLTFSDQVTLYEPEQSCLTWGFGIIDASTQTKRHHGSTKTMRKMQVGDTIEFIIKGVVNDGVSTRGAVQMFQKG